MASHPLPPSMPPASPPRPVNNHSRSMVWPRGQAASKQASEELLFLPDARLLLAFPAATLTPTRTPTHLPPPPARPE